MRIRLGKNPVLALVDGNSLLYRAFFALPALTNSLGEPTNAVYGFAVMLFKILEQRHPDHLAVCFDLPGPTFRHLEYSEYKATREKAPEDLTVQLGMAKELLDAMGIAACELEGFEADDVIGTLASRAEQQGYDVLIVTADLDALQLVSDRVRVMTTRRGTTDTVVYDRDAVKQRFGIEPAQLVDYRALKGDPTDNIPGVPGVGEKTAAKLIREHGSLEELLERANAIPDQKTGAALAAYRDQALQSKRLSTIRLDAPIEVSIDKLVLRQPDEQRIGALLRRFEFRSLTDRLAPAAVEERREAQILDSPEKVNDWLGLVREAEACAVVPVSEGERVSSARLLGIGFALPTGEQAFAPLAPTGPSLFGQSASASSEIIRPILEDETAKKWLHDAKTARIIFHRAGCRLAGVTFDSMLASYLVNPGRGKHELEDAAFDHLSVRLPKIPDAAEAWNRGAVDSVAEGACLRAGLIARLVQILRPKMSDIGVEHIFQQIELPLTEVLAEMELTGVALDCEHLGKLSATMGASMKELENQIHALAGEPFNISSHKQLAQILFDKLRLPRGKRTKTGYSTDAEVLGELAAEHQIVALVMQYRELAKLRSTYVEALPKLVNPETGRLHTSFNQAVTATGRLSSSDPNLQNIPVRTELGLEIRRAFVSGGPDKVLLSADYSQIELRILAHLSGDEQLIAIFEADEDLHTRTACELFGLSPEQVTPEARRMAKVVNFGIPYGIGPAALARDMGASVQEAAAYMERYFQRFSGVKAYIENSLAAARKDGFVRTILGRPRPLPELTSKSRGLREFAERAGINAPMQGSAADIMKLAMIDVHRALRLEGLRAKMTLQVHDELLMETPAGQLEKTAALVKRCMSEAFRLRVPLKVEAKSGPNWADMQPV